MDEFKPPEHVYEFRPRPRLFLAGSIEMGKAEDWQAKVVEELKWAPGSILNPRRADWDSSWVQSIENHEFRTQVEWELNGLEDANVIALYFARDTVSPISLMELGLFHKRHLIVCCDGEFPRKGNVDIVCKRYRIRQADTWDNFIQRLYEAVFRKHFEEAAA